MFPFTASKQTTETAQNSDFEENITALEAMQGDKALISTVNELNELRKDENQITEAI